MGSDGSTAPRGDAVTWAQRRCPASSGWRGLQALQQVQTHSGHEWLGGGRAKPGPDATRRAAGVGGLVLAGIPSRVRCTGCGWWEKN
jgi:hypothetical protein